MGYHQADMHTLPSEDRVWTYCFEDLNLTLTESDCASSLSQAVDRQISLMWRWDLGKLRNRTIRLVLHEIIVYACGHAVVAHWMHKGNL